MEVCKTNISRVLTETVVHEKKKESNVAHSVSTHSPKSHKIAMGGDCQLTDSTKADVEPHLCEAQTPANI